MNNENKNKRETIEAPFTAHEIEMILKGESVKSDFRGGASFIVEEILDDK